MKRITLLTLLLMISLALVACGASEQTPSDAAAPAIEEPTVQEEEMEETAEDEMAEEETAEEEMAEEEMASNTIVDIAVNDGRFNTLVTAVTEAGLVETLSGDGLFTVFAPTDDAFAALPEGILESLLAEPQGALTDVLLYHVVEGVVPAETVVGLDSAITIGGEEVTVTVQDGTVYLNESVAVIITDIEADNGIIHVIDAVLIPPSMVADELPTIAEIAVENGNFNTLVAALDAAGLVDTFAGEGQFTVFAPTDDAFAALPEGTVEALLADPQGDLTQILTYHVVDGAVFAEDVVNLSAAPTLQGEEIAIMVDGGTVYLNETAEVIAPDIEATNGVIHVIDAVLLPPTIAAAMADEAMGEEEMAERVTIVDAAMADGRFTTLVSAVEAAGLVEARSGQDQLTVFAPTDEAFAALPEGTVETLLADPQGQLTDILLYHVVAGAVPATEVIDLEAAPTLLGQDVTISVDEDGSVYLNETVEVIITDIETDNGIIHVIDAVLLPAS